MIEKKFHLSYLLVAAALLKLGLYYSGIYASCVQLSGWGGGRSNNNEKG